MKQMSDGWVRVWQMLPNVGPLVYRIHIMWHKSGAHAQVNPSVLLETGIVPSIIGPYCRSSWRHLL